MNTFSQWFDKDGASILFIILGAAILYFAGSKAVEIIVRQAVKSKGKGANQPRKDIEKRQKTLTSLVGNIWRTAVVIVAVVSIFRILFPRIDFSPLFASAGIVGVAVAFGSQTLVKDFLTGIFIVSENQYRVGDVVEINGAEGRVEQLGTRSTIIRDTDGNVHYIPNGSISHVVNKTMGYSRVNFTLSIADGGDIDKAIRVINSTGIKLKDDPDWSRMIIEAPQFDSIDSFSKSDVLLTIKGKVQPSDQWKVTAEMRRRLLTAFVKNGIELS